jgi:hypothetical protein
MLKKLYDQKFKNGNKIYIMEVRFLIPYLRVFQLLQTILQVIHKIWFKKNKKTFKIKIKINNN